MGKKTLAEIAAAIDAHLRRFEADPEINKRCKTWKTHPYYQAHAWRGGRYVIVQYVCYQGSSSLTREQAERYLAALDEGRTDKHYSILYPTPTEEARDAE